MSLKAVISSIQDHPKLTAWAGTAFGWISFDALRTAQVSAAILAAMVSLCALILTLPKALKEVRSWFRK